MRILRLLRVGQFASPRARARRQWTAMRARNGRATKRAGNFGRTGTCSLTGKCGHASGSRHAGHARKCSRNSGSRHAGHAGTSGRAGNLRRPRKLRRPDISWRPRKLRRPDISWRPRKLRRPDISWRPRKLRRPDISWRFRSLRRSRTPKIRRCPPARSGVRLCYRAQIRELPPQSRDLYVPLRQRLSDPAEGLVRGRDVIPVQRRGRPEQRHIGSGDISCLEGNEVSSGLGQLTAATKRDNDHADDYCDCHHDQ